jgi:hypothetical protein
MSQKGQFCELEYKSFSPVFQHRFQSIICQTVHLGRPHMIQKNMFGIRTIYGINFLKKSSQKINPAKTCGSVGKQSNFLKVEDVRKLATDRRNKLTLGI